MNVVVCVKQIPDPAAPGALDPATNTLKREGKLILDESDSYGVEMALQLVDAAGGGEVSLVSMAPNGEVSGLRTALAMGAAKAVLVSRSGAAGLRRPDDGQGPGQGHRAARRRRPRHRRHRVHRRLHRHGARADRRAARPARRSPSPSTSRSTTARSRCSARPRRATTRSTCPLPAVVSVTAGVVEPRYPSFKGIMAAKSKPVDAVTAADLGVDAGRLGRRRPGDRERDRRRGPRRRARSSRTTARATLKIVAFLESLKVI